MEYLAFTRDWPTFERGRDCWGDFAVRFQGAASDYGVTEKQAKRVLYDAITGSSSRLVITQPEPRAVRRPGDDVWGVPAEDGRKVHAGGREHSDGGGVSGLEAGEA